MARVNRIGRAGDVLPIYQELAPDLNPVILHSSETARARVEALESIRSRRSRIIVCVDMLGEGFDLPSLKIAAIHDPHKSLGVTLQFVGRFARVSDEAVGDATVVVGRPSGEVDQRLRRLYAEDSDWNKVIRDLSQGAVQGQTDIGEFEAGFGSLPDEVSMRSLLPKMSTVVYRTAASDWDPDGVLVVFPENRLLTVPIAINQGEHVAWFVTETRVPVRWGELATVEEVSYDLYVVYWNAAMGLLYINSSNSDSLHEDLAKAICGETSTRITGENVYRVMADLDRLVPTNVGVLDIRNRSRRFSLHVGADVSEGFPVAEAQTKTKTNIFAYGYEKGARVSMGASLKGRVWSYRVAETLKQWVDWCDHVGSKLVDDGLSVDEIMRHFIRPKVLEERPPLAPLALEWPWELLQSTTEEVRVQHNGSSWPLIDTELLLDSQGRAGPIEFRVATPDWELPYEMRFEEGAMRFAPRAEEVSIGSRRQESLLSEFLNGTGLFVHLEQDALVVPPGILLKPERDLAPFDTGRLQVLDWSGITLTVESQGPNRRPDSIQARMLSHVLSLADWDVVLDDDGSGELADIVALRSDGQALFVHLTHCKYVSGGEPRAQVEDLYVVCGQAQKSARWRRNIPLMLQHLIRREKNRVARRHVSGIMKGNAQTLYSMQDNAAFLRPQFTIAVAQPGASVRQITQVQLELLASSEVYVHETARSNFEVYCSA
jgi:hypothetical protein